jgi:hypothetical protein
VSGIIACPGVQQQREALTLGGGQRRGRVHYPLDVLFEGERGEVAAGREYLGVIRIMQVASGRAAELVPRGLRG